MLSFAISFLNGEILALYHRIKSHISSWIGDVVKPYFSDVKYLFFNVVSGYSTLSSSCLCSPKNHGNMARRNTTLSTNVFFLNILVLVF